jgi:predicted Holliday junction resolvase-like endonuclease
LEALKTEKQEETSTSMWPIILSIIICIFILVIGYYNRHCLKTLEGKRTNQDTTSNPEPKWQARRRNSSVNLNETLRNTVQLHVQDRQIKEQQKVNKLKADHPLLLYKEGRFPLQQFSPKRMKHIGTPSNDHYPFQEDEETNNIDQQSI